MASRLKRWSLATAIAVAGIMLATLPPGPPTIVLLAMPFWEEPEPTGLDGQVKAVADALGGEEWALRAQRVRTALARVDPEGPSPIALHLEDGSTVATVDAPLTFRAVQLWHVHQIPTDRIRTVLVTGAREGQIAVGPTRIPGVCVARIAEPFEMGWRTDRVGSSAGRCAIEARFGAPGVGVRGWADSVGRLVVPEVAPWRDPAIHTMEAGVQWPEWAIGGRQSGESRAPWWAAREVLACAKGRGEFCPEAVGLGGWVPARSRIGRFALAYPSELPAALLAELGADRFGELWRSNAPIPDSFERLTGMPFDPWAMEFVQRRIGRVEQPTALGLGGWLGWLFWMGLLTGWTLVRLRSSRAR